VLKDFDSYRTDYIEFNGTTARVCILYIHEDTTECTSYRCYSYSYSCGQWIKSGTSYINHYADLGFVPWGDGFEFEIHEGFARIIIDSNKNLKYEYEWLHYYTNGYSIIVDSSGSYSGSYSCNLLTTCNLGVTTNPSTVPCSNVSQTKYICPLTNREGCYQYAGDGNYYCSPQNPCYDVNNSSIYQTDDTVEGENDLKDDGQRDNEGNCLGNIYIFSGQDRRCRPSGLQTGFADCCKKTKTWFGLGKCNSGEQVLSKMRTTYLNKDYNAQDANCKYIGEYCAKKVLGTCIQKKRTFCCFSSPLARIIHEQGRPQFNIGWGSAKSPNCRGFTMDEFQMLDFSSIDLSEWIANFIEPEVKKQINDNLGTQMQQTINSMPTPKLPQP
jgi:hypothetical protein